MVTAHDVNKMAFYCDFIVNIATL